MTGVTAMMAGMGGGGTIVIVGSTVETSKFAFYYYGYDGALGGAASNFGSIVRPEFNGATIKAVYSLATQSAGQATSYTVIFNGNRAAGFFNTLTVNDTLVVGSLGSPSYNSTNDETSFTISLSSAAATLFGTTDGVPIPVVLT